MSCCCGHHPRHHGHGHAHPADAYQVEEPYETPRRLRRGPDSEQLDDCVAELADELAQVRHELAELRDKTTEH